MVDRSLPIKTYLICGFLGAGKTTFVIEHLKKAGPNVAVLVNEFGSLDIDGVIIKSRGGVDVVEMPGGCICCSQKQGLIAGIRDIAAQIQPELLLVEPSGVAEASELIKTLTDPILKESIRLDAVLTVIDATTFLEFAEPDAFGTFFLDQVENADIILVNKLDLVDASDIEAVKEKVAEVNSRALVLTTQYCRLDITPAFARTKHDVVSHPAHLGLNSLSIEPTCELSHGDLEIFLTKLAEGVFGEVLRAKGFLHITGYGTVNIQMTPKSTSVELLASDSAPRLTIIGRGLAEDSVAAYFRHARATI